MIIRGVPHMQREYFGEIMNTPIDNIITDNRAIILHKQHKDWTCSIACLRTILGTSLSEDWFIDRFHMQPGPYYSKDLKAAADTFNEFKFAFGCDDDCKDAFSKFTKLLTMLESDWSIMIETMYNYGHWLVLLGYYPNGKNLSDCNILLWDPYLNKIRLENAEEVISMWIDGDHKAMNDYIAVKRK